MNPTPTLNQIITKQNVHKILKNSTWSIGKLRQQIIPESLKQKNHESTTNNINEEQTTKIKKIIKQSGFIQPSTTKNLQKLCKSFEIQKLFIKHLYDVDNDSTTTEHKENKKLQEKYQFRLVYSDHLPDPPLTLNKIMEQIENLPNEVSDAKGERGFDFYKLRKE
ncbi:GTF1 [Candida jiufengensis]|uniref:GTF1 n=1 Tax=Candida jiufengensis TaxID=497108 RepID=UPI002225238F|nr:GTF1 [Candida jiufengensis]KAI5956316.1 GTF1 [Candida jiufengensis]